MMPDGRLATVDLAYLAAAVLLLLGLRGLAATRSARRGARLLAAGTAVAVVATFFVPGFRDTNILPAAVGTLIGAAAGAFLTRGARSEAIPPLLALLTGFGAAAVTLVALAEFGRHGPFERAEATAGAIATVLGGTVVSASLAAFLKARGLIAAQSTALPQQARYHAALAAAAAVLTLLAVTLQDGILARLVLILLLLVALVLGALLMLPLAAAEVPVVAAVLSVLTAIATALVGAALDSQMLLVAGTLAATAGLVVARHVARGDQRPLTDLLTSAATARPNCVVVARTGGGRGSPAVREVSAAAAAIPLAYARRVVVVPGHGLAAAQGQQALRALAASLQARGVEVRYAVHPSAGHTPGHLSTLLAEANVAYADIVAVDSLEGAFGGADVALVVGANDVVNPAGNLAEGPLAGTEPLGVERATRVIVLKRSLRPGQAGVENALFRQPGVGLLLGDIPESLARLTGAVAAT